MKETAVSMSSIESETVCPGIEDMRSRLSRPCHWVFISSNFIKFVLKSQCLPNVFKVEFEKDWIPKLNLLIHELESNERRSERYLFCEWRNCRKDRYVASL